MDESLTSTIFLFVSICMIINMIINFIITHKRASKIQKNIDVLSRELFQLRKGVVQSTTINAVHKVPHLKNPLLTKRIRKSKKKDQKKYSG